jgi:long-chain acyl-CoA synthetase
VGEIVKAFVVVDPAKRGRMKPEDIIEWAKTRMTEYKIPSVIEFRDELPTTMVGKVLRRVLKEEELAKAKTKTN